MERILHGCLKIRWQKRAWRIFLHPTPYEFSTTAGVTAYGLPDWFGRVSGHGGKIRDLSQSVEIWPAPRELLEADDPTVGTSVASAGPARRYYLAGTQPVHTQPSSLTWWQIG